MASISSKVRERVASGIKKYQPILTSAKSRDVHESDTVTIITDMLTDIFGYDKYSEITSEYNIRGTYVDLAIKLSGQVMILIEVKAIGLDLKENFIKQVVDYGANQGIDWVILTNGINWQIYKLYFNKPITQELICEFNLLNINPKNIDENDKLYLISKEGLEKSLLGEYHAKRQILNRYFIGQMIVTDTVLDVIRRELRRLSPDIKIEVEQIKEVLEQEILKREIVEGDKADEAKRKISRSSGRLLRKTSKEQEEMDVEANKLSPSIDENIKSTTTSTENR